MNENSLQQRRIVRTKYKYNLSALLCLSMVMLLLTSGTEASTQGAGFTPGALALKRRKSLLPKAYSSSELDDGVSDNNDDSDSDGPQLLKRNFQNFTASLSDSEVQPRIPLPPNPLMKSFSTSSPIVKSENLSPSSELGANKRFRINNTSNPNRDFFGFLNSRVLPRPHTTTTSNTLNYTSAASMDSSKLGLLQQMHKEKMERAENLESKDNKAEELLQLQALGHCSTPPERIPQKIPTSGGSDSYNGGTPDTQVSNFSSIRSCPGSVYMRGSHQPTPSSVMSARTTESDISYSSYYLESGPSGLLNKAPRPFPPFPSFTNFNPSGDTLSLSDNLRSSFGFNQQSLMFDSQEPFMAPTQGDHAEGYIDKMRQLNLIQPYLKSPSEEQDDKLGTLSGAGELGNVFSRSSELRALNEAVLDDFDYVSPSAAMNHSSRPASALQDISHGLKSASLDREYPQLFFHTGTSYPLFDQPTISKDERLRIEYEPWLKDDLVDISLDAKFEALNIFGLEDFKNVEDPLGQETASDNKFWPAKVQPLRDYGDFADSSDSAYVNWYTARQSIFNETYRSKFDHSERMRAESNAELTRSHFESHDSAASGSRNIYARMYRSLISYCQNCRTHNDKHKSEASRYVEAEWIPQILGHKCIPFREYYEMVRNTSDIGSRWDIKRARKFLAALIPSIFYDGHMEEVAIDFINDFMVPFVIPAELERIQNPVTSDPHLFEISAEFVKLCTLIINDLASPTMLEKLLQAVPKGFVSTEGANKLFRTLHDKMITFRVPERFEKPERDPPRPGATAAEIQAYRTLLVKDIARKLHEDDKRAALIVRRKGSFVHLQLLVKYFPEAIISPESPWTSEALLVIPPDLEDSEVPPVKAKINKKSGRKGKKKAAAGGKAKGDDDEDDEEDSAMVHHNQDFFDAMFFSPFLHIFQNIDSNIVSRIETVLEPYLDSKLMKFADPDHKETTVLHRLLDSINIFIRLTRFNSVSNVPPPILNYRRFYITSLACDLLVRVGQNPEKLISRCFSLHLHSLYEALQVYQVSGQASRLTQLSKYLNSINLYDFEAFLIFITYTPVKPHHLEKAFNEYYEHYNPENGPKKSGDSKKPSNPSEDLKRIDYCRKARMTISMLREITALVSDVRLLPIQERNVFKYVGEYGEDSSVSSIIDPDDNGSDFFDYFEAKYENPIIYEWPLTKSYKEIIQNTEEEPDIYHRTYNIFAARILLARRFGISFDSSVVKAQLSENISWPEIVGIVNFELDREAHLIIKASRTGSIDLKNFKMYKVVDPQMEVYNQWALSRDEPTHFINQLISSAIYALSPEKRAILSTNIQRENLFNLYEKSLEHMDISSFTSIPSSRALGLLKDILREYPEFVLLANALNESEGSSSYISDDDDDDL